MGSKGHVPERSCVACHKKQAKRDLIRLVRTPDGEVQVDPSGKLSGRGAYLCKNVACLDLAVKTNRLNHALKTQVDASTYTHLYAYFEQGFHNG